MTDNRINRYAFKRIRQLELMYGDDIPWHAIEKGFEINGEKIFLANKARGIFKPKQLSRGLLSIKTTIPREGRVNIYSDEESSKGYFRYSLQRGDVRTGGNKHLWEVYEDKSPFIYFYAVAPSVYKALWPCFVMAIYPEQLYCEVVVGNSMLLPEDKRIPETYKVPKQLERAYRVAESRVRIHQAAFREQVLEAYGYQCAISTLPVPALLEAAHIIPDSDPEGDALVTNGIALSRIHHRAFDANLIGIDPTYKIHISGKLLDLDDGPLLEEGLKSYHGRKIYLPKNAKYFPDPERLDRRYSLFLSEQ